MLSQLLAAGSGAGFKYQPYGVTVDKRWLFKKGGRPVICGPDSDFPLLPEAMRYRHVRFEINDTGSIDYTSEREWRIQTDELSFLPDEVTIVVPDRRAKKAFEKKFAYDGWR